MSPCRPAFVFKKIWVKNCGGFTRWFKTLEPTVATTWFHRTCPGMLWMEGWKKSYFPPNPLAFPIIHTFAPHVTWRGIYREPESPFTVGQAPSCVISRAMWMRARAPKHPPSLAHSGLESLHWRPKYFISHWDTESYQSSFGDLERAYFRGFGPWTMTGPNKERACTFISLTHFSKASPEGRCYEQINEIKIKQTFLFFLLCFIVPIFRYVSGESNIKKKTNRIFNKSTKIISRYLRYFHKAKLYPRQPLTLNFYWPGFT